LTKLIKLGGGKMKDLRKMRFTKVLAVFLIFSWVGLVSAETITYYHHDILGTPLAVSDESGDVVWWANYYPYGSKHDGNSTETDPQLFTGKEFDEELGLYYFGARYYNPTIARFISVDPEEGEEKFPQSWNRYSYCDNNPLINIDPTGCYVETAIDIASLAWSVYDVKQNPGSVLNWVALGADVVTLALPALTAGGTLIRTSKAEKVLKRLPGPSLPRKVAATFRNSKYINRKLTSDKIFYRYHGVNNRTGKKFSFLTEKLYSSEDVLRKKLAIKKEWGVDITHVTTHEVPKGTWVSEGIAASQGKGYPGGGKQIVISNMPKTWKIKTKRVK
jgi:RHS repeat-associated protein